MSEHGPIYGVELLDSLPLDGGMLQALPSQLDLEAVLKTGRLCGSRIVGGYEVLLEHYRRLQSQLATYQRDHEAMEIVRNHECFFDLEVVGSLSPTDRKYRAMIDDRFAESADPADAIQAAAGEVEG